MLQKKKKPINQFAVLHNPVNPLHKLQFFSGTIYNVDLNKVVNDSVSEYHFNSPHKTMNPFVLLHKPMNPLHKLPFF